MDWCQTVYRVFSLAERTSVFCVCGVVDAVTHVDVITRSFWCGGCHFMQCMVRWGSLHTVCGVVDVITQFAVWRMSFHSLW